MNKGSNIALIGFMGSGKSMVSKQLSIKLKRPVISTDELIIKKAKLTIPEIFRQFGEEYFRNIETLAVKEAASMDGIIIDCGGGVVLNPENLQALKQNGRVVYLAASPECILANLKKIDGLKDRPLLNVTEPLEKIKELLKARRRAYGQADIEVDADWKSIDEISDSVIKVMTNDRT